MGIVLIVEDQNSEVLRYAQTVPSGVGTVFEPTTTDALNALTDYRFSSIIISDPAKEHQGTPPSSQTTLSFLEALRVRQFPGKVYVLTTDESIVPYIAEHYSLSTMAYKKDWFFDGEVTLEL